MMHYEKVLKDLEEILHTIPAIKKVSHGKPLPLQTEDVLPAVYINPLNGVYENTQNKRELCGYDSYEYVRLIVSMECINDLDWVTLRHDIINTILSDTAIRDNIIDRDLVTWANDDFDNYPRKQFDVGFEFRLRAQKL